MKIYRVYFWNGKDGSDSIDGEYIIGSTNEEESVKIAKKICWFAKYCKDNDIATEELTQTDNGVEIQIK